MPNQNKEYINIYIETIFSEKFKISNNVRLIIQEFTSTIFSRHTQISKDYFCNFKIPHNF